MIKVSLIGGIIFLIIGASLFIYTSYASPPMRTVFDKDKILHSNSYWLFENSVNSGVKLCSEYSTSDEVEFFVLDSENFDLFLEKYDEGEEYTVFFGIYHSFGTSDSYTFRAAKSDTYYTILLNEKDEDMNFSFKQYEEMGYIFDALRVGSFLFSLIGLIGIIAGLIQKPKNVETNKNTETNIA